MNHRIFVCLGTLTIQGLIASHAVAARDVVDVFAGMKPGEWREIAGSRLENVAYRWPPGVTMTRNGTGVSAVIANWSGAAYDTRRDKLLIWGGGHFAYAGNEIYAFDINTLKWSRVSDPSLNIDQDYRAGDDIYSDGTPRSNHTYGALQYVPTIDRFCSFGTSANFPASRGGPTTWAFDFTTGRWETKSPAPGYGFGTSSAWDPVKQKIWIRINGGEAILATWNPIKDIWTVRGRKLEHKTWHNHSAAIDPIRGRYVAVGGGKIRAYDLAHPGTVVQENVISTGPQDIVDANSPGFEYDPVIDKFVGWNGGADVFTLDPDSLEWRRVRPAATNRIIPSAPAPNGTFGRFRYIPSRNLYIVVNDIRHNVFFYRLSGPERGSAPPRLLAATKSTDPELASWATQQVQLIRQRTETAK